MRYIDHILQPGEKVMYSTTIHWIVYLPGIAMLAIAAAVAVPSHSAPVLLPIAAVSALVALLLLFSAWFRRWTTEIDVTDRRIVYKRGFIRRHTVEMNMDKVESVDVDQSIMGRLFNYGDVLIRGVGVGLEPLHGVDAPLEFRNHVTAR
ncbi:MAG: PH domain-containing protein [Pseudolabrys sp.]